MIPITRNHQEGEEHAERSSVSSSVIGLTERTVLNIVNGEVVCVHRGLFTNLDAILCELCCYDAPRTTTIVLQSSVYFIRCVVRFVI